MASRTSSRTSILILSLLVLMAAAVIPHPAYASALANPPALPDLNSFIASVKNGDAAVLRGVFVPNLMALHIVQQPSGDPGYVSSINNTATQFAPAAQYGNIGLLAHNFLSGQYFFQLTGGEQISLIYGDGRVENYRITTISRFEATAPDSPTSNFINLDTGEVLTSSALFVREYTGSKHITFQTCIASNGNLSWGRLFVSAEPQGNPTPGTLNQK